MNWRLAISLTIVLAAYGGALAQGVPQGIPSPAATAKTPPTGIPGFLDNATGTFSPLAVLPSEASIGGTIVMIMDFSFEGLRKTDTVLCIAHFDFGNLVNGQFFANHHESASFNFAVGDPTTRFTTLFDYQPTSKTPAIQVSLECQASDEHFVLSTAKEIKAPQAISKNDNQVENLFDLSL